MPPKKLKHDNEKKVLPTERVEKLDVVENKSSPEVTFPYAASLSRATAIMERPSIADQEKNQSTL